jgi:YfiH family protein
LPSGVSAAFTTRDGGVSPSPWRSFNLGALCGDDPRRVAENRARLCRDSGLPEAPTWLHQVHGTRVLAMPTMETERHADACVGSSPGVVCAVLMADCLPVLFCAHNGSEIAAAHAGWRGLAAGVLESTVRGMATPPAALSAWLGPCIGPTAFEVGAEVREAFMSQAADDAKAFAPAAEGRWLADLPQLARRRLQRIGVGDIQISGDCTYSDPERYFSYRRDGQCGRMAALIWREHN